MVRAERKYVDLMRQANTSGFFANWDPEAPIKVNDIALM
jgi:hypothetical protein